MSDAPKKLALKVEHLSKSFKIPLESSNGIKQKLINTIKGRKGYRTFTPLNDISFDIKQGEFFGIVGRNGSGKSTLLKSIAGIYAPEKGKVHINGKLVPFIELGVGFNAELSGRENVFLNGALLGFSNEEMRAMYDEIVDFAELHDFMEERLKNYSSGMQVRLAFSIAIRAKADILLLDEVLAVGDEAFQRKCYEYFEELKANKKTVVLVTHSMSSVERFCDRAMFIEGGKIKQIGNPSEIASTYSTSNDKAYLKNKEKNTHKTSKKPSKIGVKLHDQTGIEASDFISGETMKVKLSWDKFPKTQNVGVAIFRKDGLYIYGTNTYIEHRKLQKKKSIDYTVKLDIPEGNYYLKVGLFGNTDQEKVAFEEFGNQFIVNRDKSTYRWEGVTNLESNWS